MVRLAISTNLRMHLTITYMCDFSIIKVALVFLFIHATLSIMQVIFDCFNVDNHLVS